MTQHRRTDVEVPHGNNKGQIVSMENALKFSLLGGDSAGDHALAGISTEDQLLAVLHIIAAGGMADLKSEFSITAINTINNADGTDTTGDQILVIWFNKV